MRISIKLSFGVAILQLCDVQIVQKIPPHQVKSSHAIQYVKPWGNRMITTQYGVGRLIKIKIQQNPFHMIYVVRMPTGSIGYLYEKSVAVEKSFVSTQYGPGRIIRDCDFTGVYVVDVGHTIIHFSPFNLRIFRAIGRKSFQKVIRKWLETKITSLETHNAQQLFLLTRIDRKLQKLEMKALEKGQSELVVSI